MRKITIDEWWVKEFRLKNKLSQVEFWAKYGVAQPTASRYENGGTKIPKSVRMLIALDLLKAPVEDLSSGRLVKYV